MGDMRLVDLPIGTRFSVINESYDAEIIEHPEGYNGKGILVLGAFSDAQYILTGREVKRIEIRRMGDEFRSSNI